MLAAGRGHITLITFIMDAKVAMPGDEPYVTAKSAMIGLTESMRQDLCGTGVKLNTHMLDDLRVPAVSGVIQVEDVAATVARGSAHPAAPWACTCCTP